MARLALNKGGAEPSISGNLPGAIGNLPAMQVPVFDQAPPAASSTMSLVPAYRYGEAPQGHSRPPRWQREGRIRNFIGRHKLLSGVIVGAATLPTVVVPVLAHTIEHNDWVHKELISHKESSNNMVCVSSALHTKTKPDDFRLCVRPGEHRVLDTAGHPASKNGQPLLAPRILPVAAGTVGIEVTLDHTYYMGGNAPTNPPALISDELAISGGSTACESDIDGLVGAVRAHATLLATAADPTHDVQAVSAAAIQNDKIEFFAYGIVKASVENPQTNKAETVLEVNTLKLAC